jgi:hypothetical protein
MMLEMISLDFEVVKTFTTPFGAPALCITSATQSAVRGVSEAGFKIMVQPAANAGPIFLVAIAAGKFQGVINAATPIGLWSVIIVLSLLGEYLKSPATLDASSENHLKNSAA